MGRKHRRVNMNRNAVSRLPLQVNPNHAESAEAPADSPQRGRRQSPSQERRAGGNGRPHRTRSVVRGRRRREREKRRREREETGANLQEERGERDSSPEPARPKKVSGVTMVVNAVKDMKERKGSTEQAIAKYLMANYGDQFDHDEKRMEKVLCRGLKTAVNAKLLELPRRGVLRYRLGQKIGTRALTSPERVNKQRGRSRTRKKPGKKRRRRKHSKQGKKKNKSKPKKKKSKGGKSKRKGRRRR